MEEFLLLSFFPPFIYLPTRGIAVASPILQASTIIHVVTGRAWPSNLGDYL